MGFVEFGSSIGSAIGSAALAVGGAVGRGVESGPSIGSVGISTPSVEVGGLTGFSPGSFEAPAPFSTIVNEGPVGPSFLENTMLLDAPGKFESTGGILFNPFPKELAELPSGQEVVAGVEDVLFQARRDPLPEQPAPEVAYLPRAAYWFTDVEPKVVKPADVIMPQIEPRVVVEPLRKGQVLEEAEAVAAKAWENNVITQAENVVEAYGGLQQKPEKKVPSQVAKAISMQTTLREEEIEETVEEAIVKEEKEVIEEETVVRRKKHLVDLKALRQLVTEWRESFEKGEKEVRQLGKNLFGSMLARIVPGQHEGNTGGAVKPGGVDGTISARREALAAKKEIKSLEEVLEVVYAMRPVTVGEEGEPATEDEVYTTHRFHVVKPRSVAVEIERKRITKKVLVPAGQPVIPFGQDVDKKESSLEDFPVLTGIFQKAA